MTLRRIRSLLRSNHGTESDPAFSYHNGKTAPRGFASLAFTVPDVAAKLAELTAAGFATVAAAEVSESTVPGLTVVQDADGSVACIAVDRNKRVHTCAAVVWLRRYFVELIKHGSTGV